MSAPRPCETDPFHPLGSISYIKQLPYICEKIPVISSMWDAEVWIYDNCACALAETLKLRFRAIFKVIIFFKGICWCVLTWHLRNHWIRAFFDSELFGVFFAFSNSPHKTLQGLSKFHFFCCFFFKVHHQKFLFHYSESSPKRCSAPANYQFDDVDNYS